jgi:photosystem II stability/assembly factor-like uncharacterized protein
MGNVARTCILGLLLGPCLTASGSPDTLGWTSRGPEGGLVTSLVADSQDPPTLYCATPSGDVFSSTDSGDSWFRCSQGLRRTGSLTALAAHPKLPGVVLAGGGSGIFRSTDAGRSWGTVSSRGCVQSLAFDPSEPDLVYAGVSCGRRPGETHPSVYRSTDGGVSWSVANSGEEVVSIVVDPQTRVVYAAARTDGVRTSSDGGVTWNATGAGLDGVRAAQLAISPGDPTAVFVTTGRGLCKSTSGGLSWEWVREGPCSTVAVCARKPSRLVAAPGYGNCGLALSTDRGATWTEPATPPHGRPRVRWGRLPYPLRRLVHPRRVEID